MITLEELLRRKYYVQSTIYAVLYKRRYIRDTKQGILCEEYYIGSTVHGVLCKVQNVEYHVLESNYVCYKTITNDGELTRLESA